MDTFDRQSWELTKAFGAAPLPRVGFAHAFPSHCGSFMGTLIFCGTDGKDKMRPDPTRNEEHPKKENEKTWTQN